MGGGSNPFFFFNDKMQNSDSLHRQQHISPVWFQEFIYNYLFIKHTFRTIPYCQNILSIDFNNHIYNFTFEFLINSTAFILKIFNSSISQKYF